jgi:hypothetical protein
MSGEGWRRELISMLINGATKDGAPPWNLGPALDRVYNSLCRDREMGASS